MPDKRKRSYGDRVPTIRSIGQLWFWTTFPEEYSSSSDHYDVDSNRLSFDGISMSGPDASWKE